MEQNKLNSILDFLAEMRRDVNPAAFFHLGDLIFRMNTPSNKFDEEKDLRIWEKNGRIEGICFYLAVDENPEYMLRPELYSTSLPKEMMHWSIQRASERGAKAIETGCIEGDILKEKFYLSYGFEPIDDDYNFMTRPMDQPLDPVDLPRGYSLVTHSQRPDLPSLGGYEWTEEQYNKFCSVSNYREELGIRVCHGDSEIAAGCVLWFDPRDKTGLVEPVDTQEAHRRKGLSYGAITRALENLKKMGAQICYVKPPANNIPAVKLYEKLGFRTTHVDKGWSYSW